MLRSGTVCGIIALVFAEHRSDWRLVLILAALVAVSVGLFYFQADEVSGAWAKFALGAGLGMLLAFP